MATPISGASAWLTLNDTPLQFQEGQENIDTQVFEYKKNYFRTTHQAPHPVEIFIDQKPLETQHYGLWQWQPADYAGLYEIRVRTPNYPDQITKVRVLPQKLTQPLYLKMQEDLSKIATDLLFRLNSPASEYADSVKRHEDISPLQNYKQIKIIIEKLQDVLAHIRRAPYCILASKWENRQLHEIRYFSGENLVVSEETIPIRSYKNGQQHMIYYPSAWRVEQPELSYDVYENRLLKQFLRKQLVSKLTAIQESANGEIQRRKMVLSFRLKHKFDNAREEQEEIRSLERVIEDCQKMKQRCLFWSSEPFLKYVNDDFPVTKASQVLLKHPYYSRFFQLYLQFQQQLKISIDIGHCLTELNMRKVADLYEMWSVFQITRMAIKELQSNGYDLISSNLFYEIEKNYFQFDVRKNVASIILNKNNTRVEIKYEPIYPNHAITSRAGLVTTIGQNLPQTPDMSIEVYRQGKPRDVIIFDAKYRWKKANDGSYYPHDEAIDKMYRYEANIQFQYYDTFRKRFQLEKIVRAAYVLYPGNKVYTESKEKIGGLPLTPDMSPQLINKVNEALVNILRAHT